MLETGSTNCYSAIANRQSYSWRSQRSVERCHSVDIDQDSLSVLSCSRFRSDGVPQIILRLNLDSLAAFLGDHIARLLIESLTEDSAHCDMLKL